jgi:hypothetical protein
MGGIVFNDASLDGVGEDAAEEPDRSGRGSRATSDDRLAAQFACLDGSPRLSSHDVFEDFVNVGFGEILHPSCADERDDVPVDAACIGADRCRLFRTSTFAQDKTGSKVGDVETTEFLDGDCLWSSCLSSAGLSPLATRPN